MRLDHGEFGGGESSGLGQHFDRHNDLANVVESGGQAQRPAALVGPAQTRCDQVGHPSHPLLVACSIGISGFQHAPNGPHCSEQGLLNFVQRTLAVVCSRALGEEGSQQIGHGLKEGLLIMPSLVACGYVKIEDAHHLCLGDQRNAVVAMGLHPVIGDVVPFIHR